MPLFDYECTVCNTVKEHVAKDRTVPLTCETCGSQIRPLYSTFNFDIDFTPGFDIGLGKYVTTKKERENIMAEKGLRRIKSG